MPFPDYFCFGDGSEPAARVEAIGVALIKSLLAMRGERAGPRIAPIINRSVVFGRKCSLIKARIFTLEMCR